MQVAICQHSFSLLKVVSLDISHSNMVLFVSLKAIHWQNCQTFNTLGKDDDSCAIEH